MYAAKRTLASLDPPANYGRRPGYGQHKPLPRLDQMKLDQLRIDQLRQAIRSNWVSFPNPVPTFERHDRADLQWKLVQLYFVLGWSCEAIAARYDLIHQRVRQILKTWKRRAVEMGFVQYIPPPEHLVILPAAKHSPIPVLDFVPLPVPTQLPQLPAVTYVVPTPSRPHSQL